MSVFDNIPPVITFCPSSQTFQVSPGTNGLSVTWQEPQATDNSGVAPTVTSTHSSGNFFNIGFTNVAYTFSDGAGNQARCEFTITVNGKYA